MTAELVFAMVACHMAGDYLIQTDWMASQKTKHWRPAIAHGVTYTIPFALFVTRSPLALLAIGGTHILIDHWRLAKYVIWLKNQIGAKRTYVYQFNGLEWSQRYSTEDRMAGRPIHENMSVAPPWAKKIRTDPMAWPPTETGYPADMPPWMAVWLMIIADNVIHILINYGAVKWL